MDQAMYYWSHPPKCIAGFAIRAAELPGVVFDGHGEELNTVFALSCDCSRQDHYVLGHYWRNPDFDNILVFLSPLALRCAACGKVTELLDTDKNGYDGELGHGSATKRGVGERVEYRCEKCGPMPFSVFARFEYPNDLFDGTPAFADRQHDLFTWFSLVGKCAGCSQLLSVTEFECA